MAFRGTGKTRGLYLAAMIISIVVGGCWLAMTEVYERILVDWVVWIKEKDDRDKGIR